MCVLACKIWPLFKKLLGKKYPFLRWNQLFKTTFFFSKSRKKGYNFQKTPIFKKARKTFKWWLFTIFINIHKFIIQRQFVCLNYFKNTLLTSLYIAQSQVHRKELIADRSQEKSKYNVKKYTPFFKGFTIFQVKNTPISRFREIGFKIPLYSWNLEHTLDHKWPPGK